jgi:hypothetical protein
MFVGAIGMPSVPGTPLGCDDSRAHWERVYVHILIFSMSQKVTFGG